MAGATFLVIGVLLMLEALDVIDLRAAVVPALLLIGLGVALLARAERRRPPRPPEREPPPDETGRGAP